VCAAGDWRAYTKILMLCRMAIPQLCWDRIDSFGPIDRLAKEIGHE
jgi:hypothetical protein